MSCKGFISNGCLRLRDKDLYELFTIVKQGYYKSPGIKVRLSYKDQFTHPYPMEDSRYKQTKRFGGYYDADQTLVPVQSAKNPESKLTITEWVYDSAPPMEKIGRTYVHKIYEEPYDEILVPVYNLDGEMDTRKNPVETLDAVDNDMM